MQSVPISDAMKNVRKRMRSKPAGTETSDRIVGTSRPIITKTMPCSAEPVLGALTSGQLIVSQRP